MNPLAWPTLAVGGVAVLTVDLLWSRRKSASDLRQAAIATGVWTVVGLAFAGIVAAVAGGSATSEYIAVFGLEKTLSLDNVAVFAAILTGLAIPIDKQGTTLTGGLVGALLLRIVFIAAGLALVDAVHPLLVVFGVALLLTGARMIRSSVQDDDATDHDPPKLRWAPAKLRERPELLALAAIVVADVAFAADSIFAAFAVTTSSYPIVAANVFAVLGLRPLYVVLAHAMQRFRYLPHGVGVLLCLIGVELVLEPVFTMPPWGTLLVVVVTLAGSIGVSLVDRKELSVKALARRVGVTIGGFALLAAGAAMLVLPGPGILVIVAGLALLATEYDWAKKPLNAARARLNRLRNRDGGAESGGGGSPNQ